MGAVAFAPYHDGNLAAILVLTFTAVSGLVSPLPQRPKHRRDQLEGQGVAESRLVGSLTG